MDRPFKDRVPGKSLGDQKTGGATPTAKKTPFPTPTTTKMGTKVLGERKQLALSTPIKRTPIPSHTPKTQTKSVLKNTRVADVTTPKTSKVDSSKLGIKLTPARKLTPVATSVKNLSSKRLTDKSNVSILHEQVQLRNDVVMVKEDLVREVKDNNSLRKELTEKNQIIEAFALEKSNLASQLSQLRTEMTILNSLLEDESQCRQQTDAEAKEIQLNKDRELEIVKSELRAELSLKEDVVRTKSDLIVQQEGVIAKLRQEVKKLMDTSNIAGQTHSSMLSNNSRSCRSSISNMQSSLTSKLEEVERQSTQESEKHKIETSTMRAEHENALKNLKTIIQKKDAELEEFRGRLLESRQARDSTLLEIKRLEHKYEATIEGLRFDLEKKNAKLNSLEEHQAEEEEYSLQVQVLEGQLDQTIKMNRELSKKLDSAKLQVLEFQDQSNKLADLSKENADLLTEVKTKLSGIETLEAKLKDSELLLVEKNSQLEKEQRKVESKIMNISLLKEACSVLDAQLKEFEVAFLSKEAELMSLKSKNQALEAEKTSLHHEMNKLKIASNETASLRIFYESRLKNAEQKGTLKEKQAHEELEKAQQKIKDTLALNSDLNTKLNKLKNGFAEVTLEKNKTEKAMAALENELIKINESLNKLSDKNATLLEEKLKLTKELSETMDKLFEYKNRYESICSDQQILVHDKIEKDVQLKSTIRQQAKLIEYLQQQNELLLKKKDKRFQIFGKLYRDENCPTTPLTKDTADNWEDIPTPSQQTPSTFTLKPVNLIREHFNLQKLEQTAEELRKKLASLKSKEGDIKVSSENPELLSKKEECILLKDKNDKDK